MCWDAVSEVGVALHLSSLSDEVVASAFRIELVHLKSMESSHFGVSRSLRSLCSLSVRTG